jgi:hypothetical protein
MSNQKEEYYKTFALSGIPKSALKDEELANLYTRPKKEKVQPSLQTWIPNAVHQADLLMMPEDPKGFKYILTCVDIATRNLDAEPLKDKSSAIVLKGFKAIYKRKYLKPLTRRLEVDDGNEFKGCVKQYFIQNLKVHVRAGQPGRHRQQCIVECMNKLIGQALHQQMAAQELLTGEPSCEWVEDLPIMVRILNRRWQRKPPKQCQDLPKLGPILKSEQGSSPLILEGTKVRVALDEPQGINGEKLHGRFRASDIRWDPEIKTIRKCILSPGQPPMYMVSGPYGKLQVARASYTRNNLQIVPENENPPPPTVIRGQPERFIPEKIIKSRYRKKKLQYLVKWKRFPEDQATWESAENLKEDYPTLLI